MYSISRVRLTGAVLGASLILSACSDLDSSPPVERRYGSLVIEGTNASQTEVSATAMAIFFTTTATTAVPSSSESQNDACIPTTVDTTAFEVIGSDRAGEELTLQIGAEPIPMEWHATGFRYQTPPTAPFTYTSGTSAQISVPGNGEVFPAGNVSVLLAEPIFAPDVTVSSTENMVVTWNASSNPTSAVLLSLRYADPANAGYGNMQIVCQLKDDGSMVIPLSGLTDVLASPPMHRSLTLSRYRTNEVNLDDVTLLHINSQVLTEVTLK